MLPADTSGFSADTDLQVALQTAIDGALMSLGQTAGDIVFGIDGGSGAFTLTGEAGLSARGNIAFAGSDVAAVLDKFGDLTFTEVMDGLDFVVDLLARLDGSDGDGTIPDLLDASLPLIDLGIADMVDIGTAFAAVLDDIRNDPATTVQALNTLIAGKLGLAVPEIVVATTAFAQIVTTVDGGGGPDEAQVLTVSANSGSFTLTLEDPGLNTGNPQTTAAITFDPTDATTLNQVRDDINAALDLFTDVAVDVARSGSEFTITFTMPTDTDVAELVVDDGLLVGDEVQTVTLNDAIAGTFTLSFDGEETDPIAYNASASCPGRYGRAADRGRCRQAGQHPPAVLRRRHPRLRLQLRHRRGTVAAPDGGPDGQRSPGVRYRTARLRGRPGVHGYRSGN